jgi:hypothetical protein
MRPHASRETAQKGLEILKNLFQEVFEPSETPGRQGPARGIPQAQKKEHDSMLLFNWPIGRG